MPSPSPASAWRRAYRLALLLTGIVCVFAFTAGMSPWQGNRLFYPGQIATAPLLAVVLLGAWDRVTQRSKPK